MPELPEVEVVRRGLQESIPGRQVRAVEVRHPRAVRRQLAGSDDFATRLRGQEVVAVSRRGKYLWLRLGSSQALLAHLGMSGQLLVKPPGAAPEPHLRVSITFADSGPQLRFVDQRTFGVLALDDLVTEADGGRIPSSVRHIARDPLDPGFDIGTFVARLLARRTEVKRALLDQGLISGIGNIYADESLWRARLHGGTPASALTPHRASELVSHVTRVFSQALAAGGTSFDSLYVDVDGNSGYFSRSLAVYGRQGQPCARCGAVIVRGKFMNRSSFWCPECQPAWPAL